MTPARVRDIGLILIGVDEMDASLEFYRDFLGFQVVEKVTPVWTEVRTEGAL